MVIGTNSSASCVCFVWFFYNKFTDISSKRANINVYNFKFKPFFWPTKFSKRGLLILLCESTLILTSVMWCESAHGSILWFSLKVRPQVSCAIIQRMSSPMCEVFPYGVQHISLWFNEVWPYASLNYNGIRHILYENASCTGLHNLCIRLRPIIWQNSINY